MSTYILSCGHIIGHCSCHANYNLQTEVESDYADSHDQWIQKSRRASQLAIKGYQSARLGNEICFGVLPEAD